jgi:hypothetical protein
MPVAYGIAAADGGSGLMAWSRVEGRLAEARSYWICTTRPDGRPHAAPVWGLWLNEAVCFSTDPASLKGKNLARSPEIVVHLESGDDVVIVEGRAEAISDAGLLGRFADAYGAKYGYRPEPGPAVAIYYVRPRVVLAWLEQDFTGGATRWAFD